MTIKRPGPPNMNEYRGRVDFSKWVGKSPPPVEWLVQGIYPVATTCGMSGDGGVGKSLLLQQLLTACAVGQRWLGLEVKHCRAYGFFCEDSWTDLWRRQDAINRLYGVSVPDLEENLMLVSRKGFENCLCEFDRRTDRAMPTDLFRQLFADVEDFGAQLVVIDTAADTFGGQEYVRNQVRRFITTLTGRVMNYDGTIILAQHPSAEGTKEGSGRSGSTGWNNAYRARTYLTRPPREEGQDEVAADTTPDRVLRVVKNNYARGGDKIRLRFTEGVFVPIDASIGEKAPEEMSAFDKAELDGRLVMAMRELVRDGTKVAASQHGAKSGFVNVMRRHAGFSWLSVGVLAAAQDRLVSSGRLVRVELGPPSERVVCLRPPDLKYPSEPGLRLV